jgi:hypothetical protein
VEVKGGTITIFTDDQAEKRVSMLSRLLPFARSARAEETLSSFAYFMPMMRFVLADQERRLFLAERYCFRGSVDDWIVISAEDALDRLVRQFVRHLGRESFYELFGLPVGRGKRDPD